MMPQVAGRDPSGLFPSGQPRPSGPSGPARPRFREPHPVRGWPVAAGLGSGALWMLLWGLLGGSVRGYVWWTVAAGLLAWGAAIALARIGDRGVAAGIAIATGLGWSIATVVVFGTWAASGWPLW